jgi:hypothetical protein
MDDSRRDLGQDQTVYLGFPAFKQMDCAKERPDMGSLTGPGFVVGAALDPLG